MNRSYVFPVFALFAMLAACSSTAENAASSDDALKGCHGKASSTKSPSGSYFLTSFGGPGDGQKMSCGQSTKNGSWYYAASRQRYGCGAHLKVEANGKCVVVETDDYGPDICVENSAGAPVLDVSPLATKHLFGTSSAGWSDRMEVTVTEVSSSTALGPCAGGSSANPPTTTPPKPTSDGGTLAVPPEPPGDCIIDDDCNIHGPSAQMCQSGICVIGCHTGLQCPGAQICEFNQCTSEPMPPPDPPGDCLNDDDCNPNGPAGRMCDSGSCVYGCHNALQCPGAQICPNSECIDP